jgi:uncharacterized protein YwgA
MNSSLKVIYERVYGSPFNYEDFESRKKLQKAVYLLENMGVAVGDYSFSWDSYGPYSLSLDCEASQLDESKFQEFSFSSFAEDAFNRLKDIVAISTKYDVSSWMECIASVHYLKNVFRIQEDNVIDELVRRKPYLSDAEANRNALAVANTIRIGA